MEKIKEFVEKHPWGTAAIVFVAGLLLIWLFFGGRSSSTQTTDAGTAGYYNAQAAAIQSGGQVYATQIAAQADVAKSIAGYQTALALAQEQGFTMRYGTNLQAQTDERALDTSVQIQQINADAALSQSRIVADATTQEASIAASVAKDTNLRTLQGISTAAAASAYNSYLTNYAAVEKFVASPDAGKTQGTTWGGFPVAVPVLPTFH